MCEFNKFPTLSYCCCFVDLQIGCLIVGFINILTCVLFSLTYFIEYEIFGDYQVIVERNRISLGLIGVGFSLISIAVMILSSYLIIGVVKQKSRLIRVYLIGMSVCLALYVPLSVLSAVFYLPDLIPDSIVILLSTYFWFIAHSYRQKVEKRVNFELQQLDEDRFQVVY